MTSELFVDPIGSTEPAGAPPLAALGVAARFAHDLDPQRYTVERVDRLLVNAPPLLGQVKLADEGVERLHQHPEYDRRLAPLPEDLEARRLHAHVYDVHEWAAAPYREDCARILDAAGSDPAERHRPSSVVRVFGVGVTWPFHAEGERFFNCAVVGRTRWHVVPPSELSQWEHEALHSGGKFLPWGRRRHQVVELEPGQGLMLPSRWAHWVENVDPEPAVLLCVGYWDRAAVRERKVQDVNHRLRRLGLRPRPPGRSAAADRVKRTLFDLGTYATRRLGEFRGI